MLREKDKIIKYKSLPENNIVKINGRYDRKAYYQYSLTIEMTDLMTVNEIEKIGYQIAMESRADVIWL